MEKYKLIIVTSIILALIFIAAAGSIGFFFGKLNSTLTIETASPKQLAEAMQADRFYSDYNGTMLLVNGTVSNVSTNNGDFIVSFVTTNSKSVLPKVSCNFGTDRPAINLNDDISILAVAHNASRENVANVLLNNCYLLK